MPPKKIVFLGSKPVGYQCLSFLLENAADAGAEVIAIATQTRREFDPAQDLAALAKAHNIPILQSMAALPDCDIVYSVQHHELLLQPHIDKARQIAVNLHMAPLPEYRGCNQFSFAIIDGKAEFGATLHAMDARIDHGDILFQKRFPVPKNCWVDELYMLTEAASVALFRESLPAIIAGDYQRIPQRDLVAQYGTSLHYRNEIAALKQLSVAWPEEKISRHLRATSMPGFEPPYFLLNGGKIYCSRTWTK